MEALGRKRPGSYRDTLHKSERVIPSLRCNIFLNGIIIMRRGDNLARLHDRRPAPLPDPFERITPKPQ
jgi:hypothetical protein